MPLEVRHAKSGMNKNLSVPSFCLFSSYSGADGRLL